MKGLVVMGAGNIHQQLFGCCVGDGLVVNTNCPLNVIGDRQPDNITAEIR